MSLADDTEAGVFLLLLPPLPSSSDDEIIKSTYGDTIKQVLVEVQSASSESTDAAILEIALACPHLITTEYSSSFQHFEQTQKIVAQAYRLIYKIATKENIDIEDADGVDVRVLLINWRPDESDQTEHKDKNCTTPLAPTLKRLAASGRAWQYAFGVENDEGEAMVRAFIEAKQSLANSAEKEEITSSSSSSSGPATCVAVGGTFDHLHIGHKLLLTMTLFAAFDQPSSSSNPTAIVGITGDKLLEKKQYAEHLESWSSRQNAIVKFVQAISYFGHSLISSRQAEMPVSNGRTITSDFDSGLSLRCVELFEPCGPTITEEAVDALIISAETRSGGESINKKRVEQNWRPVKILEVDVLDAGKSENKEQNFASKVSSTSIRQRLHEKTHSAACACKT